MAHFHLQHHSTLIRFLLLVLLLIILGYEQKNSVMALTQSSPLVLEIGENFYTWDGVSDPKPLTSSNYNFHPVLSPNGTEFAYLQYPKFATLEFGMEGGYTDWDIPTDIWILNPSTAQARQIASQPEGATYDSNHQSYATPRSPPSWSPDGTQLAWLEYTYGPQEQLADQLVVYDLAAGTTTVLADIPVAPHDPQASSGLVSVLWTADGLIVQSVPNGIDTFYVYDADGMLLRTFALPGNIPNLIRVLPVQFENQTYLATNGTATAWQLINPRTGEMQPSPAWPELYSPNNPQGLVASLFSRSQNGGGYSIQLQDDQRFLPQPITLGYDLDDVALSPEGTALAYLLSGYDDNHTAQHLTAIWRDDSRFIQGNPHVRYGFAPDALVWGPTAWRIREAFVCPGAPETKLQVGVEAVVIDGLDTEPIFDRPSAQGNMRGQVRDDAVFVVEGGPRCSDGRLWWLVDFDGVSGWVAETQDGQYLLTSEVGAG